MNNEQFLKMNEELVKISLAIEAGDKEEEMLAMLNNNIDYLNIQIDYTQQEHPSDNLNEYYTLVNLCLLHYRARDLFLL